LKSQEKTTGLKKTKLPFAESLTKGQKKTTLTIDPTFANWMFIVYTRFQINNCAALSVDSQNDMMPRMFCYDMGCVVPQLNSLRSLSSINLTGQAEFSVQG
jgi:hypothetical protein